MTTTIVQLPWTKPPLSMNDRMHWAPKAKITAGIRRDTHMLADDNRLPRGLTHVTVALHYRPRDRRRRDTDNLMPVLKACCDGLVDYGLVPDDTPTYMAKRMPLIDEPQKGAGGAMWLEVTWEDQNGANERPRAAQAAGTGNPIDTKDHQ